MSKDFENLTWGTPEGKFIPFFLPIKIGRVLYVWQWYLKAVPNQLKTRGELNGKGQKSISKDFENLTFGTPEDKFITFFPPIQIGWVLHVWQWHLKAVPNQLKTRGGLNGKGLKSMSKDLENLTWGTPKDKFIIFFPQYKLYESYMCDKGISRQSQISQWERSEKYVKRFRKFDWGYTQR